MSEQRSRTVVPLHAGPLDIIGDVHGEFDALRALIGHLGYDEFGLHPDGRRAVFVGDLCDRGPDSPAVIDLVMGWVQSGRAQCVLGNHELNVLLDAPKHGNGWFFDRDHDVHNGRFLESKAATPERRTHWLQFLERLPMALEREDLRIVHACWDGAAIRVLDSASDVRGPRDMYQRYKADAKRILRDSGIDDRAALEMRDYRQSFEDPLAVMPLLPACAEEATLMQNANPLKVLTSGREAPAETPAWAGGKWRMTNRSRWWRAYHDEPAVLIGHYWRRDARATAAEVTGDWDYPLGDYGPYEWMGPRGNVFCVDYAVGGRYAERAKGRTAEFKCRLAAMRWPERELVFDDGQRIDTQAPSEKYPTRKEVVEESVARRES
jgi:hypothetical protein